MSESLEHAIAIVGMAGKFPGAGSVEALWTSLSAGIEGIQWLDDAALKIAGVDLELLRDPAYVKARGTIERPDLFDAEFFGLSAREAASMDPQQRLFLESVWTALEDANHVVAPAGDAIGVFAAAGANSYLPNHVFSNEDVDLLGTAKGYAAFVANEKDFLATRVAYKLNLHGPAISIQTACSSSLVAVHLACQSLLSLECDAAIAGGVTVMPSPRGYLYQEGLILSSDGRCRPFDQGANGTVPSDGVGVVVLKRYADARKDRDRIRALILASAINNDGARKVGYTAPSVEGQVKVIATALSLAGVSPEDVQYVEGHGTGTYLGDAIELTALRDVFGSSGAAVRRRYLGSIKSNLGHLDTASGVVGLIKTVLALEHAQIPATLHVTQPHELLAGTTFVLPDEPVSWPSGEVRRAGVSSFGIGGTNAHVVLQESPPLDPARDATAPRTHTVLVVSAKSAGSLRRAAAAYAARVANETVTGWNDVAYTAAIGREQFDERLAVVAENGEAAAKQLRAFAEGQPSRVRVSRCGQVAGVVFLFTGQGSQYAGMGRELWDSEPAYRRELARCDKVVRDRRGRSLISVMHDADDALLNRTEWTQPALYALQCGLLSLWAEWGVKPAAVLGHSVGEYAAAYAASAFGLEDGMELVLERSAQMSRLADDGAMVAMFTSEQSCRSLLEAHPEVSLAAVNAVDEVVLSGPLRAVSALVELAQRYGIKTKRLQAACAFHSAAIDPMLDAFERYAATHHYSPLRVPFHCNLTGGSLEHIDAAYFREQLRAPVRFLDALCALSAAGFRNYLELGPTPTLAGLGVRTLGDSASFDASLRQTEPAVRTLLDAAGSLWTRGSPLDWRGILPPERHTKVSLPSYAFDRQRHWISTQSARPRRTGNAPALALLGRRLDTALGHAVFETELDEPLWEMLADHRYFGTIVFPAVGFLVALWSAAAEALGTEQFDLCDVEFMRPLVLEESRLVPRLQVIVSPLQDGEASVELFCDHAGPWSIHARGQIRIGRTALGRVEPRREPESDALEASVLYESLVVRDVVFGPSFRWLERLWLRELEGYADLRQATQRSTPSRQRDLCSALEAGLQLLSAVAMQGSQAGSFCVPVAVERFAFDSTLTDSVGVQASANVTSGVGYRGDARLIATGGNVQAMLEGVRYVPVAREGLLQAEAASSVTYEPIWEKHETSSAPPPHGRWLLLGRGQLVDQLEGDLRAAGVTAVRGPSDTGSLVDAGASDGIADWFGQLSPDDAFECVVYVEPETTREDPTTWAHAYLLAVAQGVLRSSAMQGARLSIVTDSTQHVLDAMRDVTAPAGALTSGFARVFASEHPDRWGTLVDVDDAPRSRACVLAALLDPSTSEIALRHGVAYTPRIRPTTIRAPQSIQLHGEAVYLVTGGAGGLGMLTAEWLVRQGARHLVLIGRSDPTPSVEETFVRWRDSGVDVQFHSADAARADALDSVLHSIRAGGRRLAGIVHAAGAIDDSPVLHLTPERIRHVVAGKVLGAFNLHRATEADSLDFTVYYSSAASILAFPAQANYAAANAFLDAFAHYRNQRGQYTVSMNWGPWRGAGMAAVSPERERNRRRAMGIGDLVPDVAFALLETSLGQRRRQLLVAELDMARAAAALPRSSWLQGRSTTPGSEVRQSEHWKALSAVERNRALRAFLRESVAEALGLAPDAPIEPRRPLRDTGLDSLMAVTLRNKLVAALGIRLSSTLLFDHPTLEALSAHVREQFETTVVGRAAVEPVTPRPDGRFGALPDVEHLSQAEVQQLLDAKLASLDEEAP